MKYKFAITSLIFLIGAIIPVPVQAHVLKTDGNIGAVLHIDPDDDPIVNSQASFFFEFKDKTQKFDPKNCNCEFTIMEQGNQIFSQPLFASNPTPSLSNANVFFIFPKKDVYQVQVIGKPLTPNAFQSFTLIYDVRVDRQIDPSQTVSGNDTSISGNSAGWFSTHLFHIFGALIGFGFLIFALIFQAIKKKNQM